MIKYVWLIILLLCGFCQVQPKDTADTVLQCSAAPHPSTSGFTAGLRFPALAQVSSAQTRSEESRNSFIEKSQLWAQQAQQKAIIERACMNSSPAEIADFFEQCRAQGIFSDEELLTWYPLYQSSSYRAYVKGLPGYTHHVTQLHHEMSRDKKTQKKTAQQMNLTLESAQKLADHLWNELQKDSVEREAYERMQQAALEASRIKQEQYQTIKITQQQVLLTQAPLLEQCITQWKVLVQENTNDVSARYMSRIHMADSNHWHEQLYQISTDVNTLLANQNIAPDSYTQLYGNGLQHSLHREFLSILDHIALNNKNGVPDKFVTKLNRCAVECTDIGCAYNKEGASAHASMIADAGWALLDLTSAVAEGIRDATIHTADLVMHPLQTLCAINRSIFYFVVSTGDGLLYKDTDYQYVPESRTSVLATYNAIGHELLNTAHQMKTRDWVKGVTCFATECVLQAKLINTLASLSKGAGKYALHCVRTIESSLAEAKAAVAGMEGITTEIKLGETIAQVAAQEETLFNLIKQADGTYRSSAGVIYGPDPNFGNRAYHVLEHIKEVIGKRKHTVFNVTGEELFALIDEAWLQKGTPLIKDPRVYLVDMKRIIGTKGETTIRIVAYEGTSNIISAYPV